MVPFPFTSQRYYQFSRFILQYNKMNHIFCYSNNNVYFFSFLLIYSQEWVKLTLEKNDISEKFRRFFKKFRNFLRISRKKFRTFFEIFVSRPRSRNIVNNEKCLFATDGAYLDYKS